MAATDSIAVDGTTVVVGAHEYFSGGTGLVRVFVREVGSAIWILQTELMAGDASIRDSFGYSVAVSGDTLVVGAPLDDDRGTNSGSAYVFVRSNGDWLEQTKLTASDGAEFDEFGISVDISGDTIAVGAHKVNNNGVFVAGAVYIYVWDGSTWIEQAKLTASDGANGDALGSSVAIDGNTVVSGAPFDGDTGRVSGTAYIFVREAGSSIWMEQAELRASDGAKDDWSVNPVAISDDTVVIGYSGGVDAGSAYVFGRSGSSWTQLAKLTASDGAAGDEFGYSVAIQGTTVAVGARLDDNEGGTDSGSAYVFVRSDSSWTQFAKLTASDGKNLGHSASISGDVAAVGASGSSYTFNITEEALSQGIPLQGESGMFK